LEHISLVAGLAWPGGAGGQTGVGYYLKGIAHPQLRGVLLDILWVERWTKKIVSAQTIRDEYFDTLAHIQQVFPKLMGHLGRNGIFSFPDVHKLSEGLFLSAWTYWEGFLRALISEDLATDPKGILVREVTKFRYINAPYRLAERILNHPDHPDKFVEWPDYGAVVKRANEFLGPGHRFVTPLPQDSDLTKLRRIRNAIAHKSDKAWASFTSLVSEPPFKLQPVQRRGITPGRFLSSHEWNGAPVLQTSVNVLRSAAQTLVP